MKVVIDKIHKRMEMGKAYSIVAVAEGVEVPTRERPATYFAREIEAQTGFETRETVLGYIQRGGSPSPYDRILGTLLGGHAATLIHEGKFGRMVARLGNTISDVPLAEVAGKLRLITPDSNLIQQGRKMGISFGVW
jgi:6-phosphofructokinase 1